MRTDCDRRWEIDAIREGALGAKDAEAFQRHARACDICAPTIARDARVRELATSLPASEPNDLDLRRLRSRVLHEVATGTPAHHAPSAPLAFALALALVAVVSGAFVRSGSHATAPPTSTASSTVSPPAPPPADLAMNAFAGAILRADGARWSQTRDGLVERMRLEEGTLKLHVRHQTGAERFLVELPDGELEVHGTTFEVSVHAAATDRVYVEEGVVAVRMNGLTELELKAGEAWSAPRAEGRAKATAHAAPLSAAKGVDPSPLGSAGATGSALVSAHASAEDGADAYAAAISLLQSGQYSAAASAFRAFLLAHPQTSQVEDASFLEATALARAGRPDAAALAAEDHLARFPKSFHRREAAILIARAARDRGECAQARTVLAPWLGNPPDDEARATLKRCAEQ